MNETQCARARRLVAAGPGGTSDREALERHLAGCAECRRFAAEVRELDRAMAALPAPEPPAGFVDRVMARLPDAAPQPGPAARPRVGEWVGLWASAAAVAVAAVASLASWGRDWVEAQAAGAVAAWQGWLASSAAFESTLAAYGKVAGWGLAAAVVGAAAWLTGLGLLWRGLDDFGEGGARHA